MHQRGQETETEAPSSVVCEAALLNGQRALPLWVTKWEKWNEETFFQSCKGMTCLFDAKNEMLTACGCHRCFILILGTAKLHIWNNHSWPVADREKGRRFVFLVLLSSGPLRLPQISSLNMKHNAQSSVKKNIPISNCKSRVFGPSVHKYPIITIRKSLQQQFA